MAQDLVHHRRGRFLTIADANSFFGQLYERVYLLTQTHQQNPGSISLAVNSAKQFVARNDERVQLHDLILREMRRAIELRDVPELANDEPLGSDALNKRANRYEALSEPLARIFGVLGRHGDGTEFQLVADVLRTFTNVPMRGGTVFWIEMHKKYPAMLMLFAYGLGALKASRFKACFDLFALGIQRDNEQSPTTAAEYLFLYSAGDSEHKRWKLLAGLERNRTPLNDHLLDIFATWCNDYIVGSNESIRVV